MGPEPPVHLLPEARHDEQGVVDAHCQPHHGNDRDHEDRDGEDGADEIHRGQRTAYRIDPDNEGEESSDECPEGEHQYHGGGHKRPEFSSSGILDAHRANVPVQGGLACDLNVVLGGPLVRSRRSSHGATK